MTDTPVKAELVKVHTPPEPEDDRLEAQLRWCREQKERSEAEQTARDELRARMAAQSQSLEHAAMMQRQALPPQPNSFGSLREALGLGPLLSGTPFSDPLERADLARAQIQAQSTGYMPWTAQGMQNAGPPPSYSRSHTWQPSWLGPKHSLTAEGYDSYDEADEGLHKALELDPAWSTPRWWQWWRWSEKTP